MLSNSQRLRRKIAMQEHGLLRASAAIWLHPNLRELYPEFLHTVYSITRATAPSMHEAAACAAKMAATDPVAAAVADYLEEHAFEETGHDLWTLNDLKLLGASSESVRKRLPTPAVAALVGSQYYWIHHFHPVAYLSYVAVLEGPQTISFLEEVVERTGLPREALTTHFLHAELDPHHVKAFDEFVDNLPLTAAHHEILGVNAIATTGMLQEVFEELFQRFERNSASISRELVVS